MSSPNPVLKRLGLGPSDRVVLLHADDIGMCQATLTAYADLLDAGLISSASTMVPCPWFPSVAALCRGMPQADMGVHLTLTNEYTAYRWGPLSTRDPASGLIDQDGYFFPGPVEVQQAGGEAVRKELQAQLDRALQAGVDVTHLDTHQLSVLHPEFVVAYADLAVAHRLPIMLLRADAAGWQRLSGALGLPLSPETAQQAAAQVQRLEELGLPMVDHAAMLPLDQPAERIALAKRVLDSLPTGLTHLVIHPAADTPEMRAITADWPSRVADYQAFVSAELRDHVRNSGIHVIGYRRLRDLARN